MQQAAQEVFAAEQLQNLGVKQCWISAVFDGENVHQPEGALHASWAKFHDCLGCADQASPTSDISLPSNDALTYYRWIMHKLICQWFDNAICAEACVIMSAFPNTGSALTTLLGWYVAGHGMLGELAAELTCRAVMCELSSQALRWTQLSKFNPEALQRMMTMVFNVSHQAAVGLYKTAPRHYTYPKGSP